MLLVEPFAVVGVLAAAHFGTAAQPHLLPPIRVGEALTGRRDEVRIAALQDRFGLCKVADAAGGDDRRGVSRGANGAADGRGKWHVAAEGADRVAPHGWHALVAGGSRVGVRGLADVGLLRVVELATLADRQEVEAGACERLRIEAGVLDATAVFDYLIAEKARPDAETGVGARAHGGEDLERQSQAGLWRTTISIGAHVRAREERGHRIGVRVVQFDAIKAGRFGARRGVGEQDRQHARQFAKVRLVQVVHFFAEAEGEVTELARPQQRAQRRLVAGGELSPHGVVVGRGGSAKSFAHRGAVVVVDWQEPREELRGFGPSANREEVEDLQQDARLAAAALAHRSDQIAQSRHKPVVADAQ